MKTFTEKLFEPIHASSLGLFRILFGILMFWQLQRLFTYIVEELPKSQFFLTYDFFHWVKIGTTTQMSILFYALFASCICISLGFFYRTATATLFFGWTYIFLLCRGHYNNHYYLLCLIPLLMFFTKADSWGSLKAFWNDKKGKTNDYQIPYWQLFILQFQIFIVYFYGGISKINSEWLQAYPMKIWLYDKQDIPMVGSFISSDIGPYFLSYGGLIFDLLIAFALFHKTTRHYAIIFILFFHITNHFFWNIGIFPWFMIATTLLFFDADLPNRIFKYFKQKKNNNSKLKNKKQKNEKKALKTHFQQPKERQKKLVLSLLTIYFAVQLLFPFRWHFYGGNPSWHGVAHFFSWRMMLTDRSHALRIRVALPEKGTIGYLELEEYVNRKQFSKMCRSPKTFGHFAHFIQQEMEKNANISDAEIYVSLWKSLNLRPYQMAIDSTKNLAAQTYSPFKKPDFILDLDYSQARKSFDELTEEEKIKMGLGE